MGADISKCPKMSGNVRFSAKQELTILELLSPENRTFQDVAAKVRVNEKTLRRWIKLPHFEERLKQGREQLRNQAFDTLKSTLNKAVERLGDLLDSKNESIQLRGAQSVIDFNLKVTETEELEARLKALEEAIERRK